MTKPIIFVINYNGMYRKLKRTISENFYSDEYLSKRIKMSDALITYIISKIDYMPNEPSNYDYYIEQNDIENTSEYTEVKYPDWQFGALAKKEVIFTKYTSGNRTKTYTLKTRLRKRYFDVGFGQMEQKLDIVQLDDIFVLKIWYSAHKVSNEYIPEITEFECDDIESLIQCIYDNTIFHNKKPENTNNIRYEANIWKVFITINTQEKRYCIENEKGRLMEIGDDDIQKWIMY